MPKNRPDQPRFAFSEDPIIAHYDWRLAAVTTISADTTLPGGRMWKAGSPVVAVCPINFNRKIRIRYNMPSVCGLLLDFSHQLYIESADVISLFRSKSPDGLLIVDDDSPLLYALERRMAAVVFAFTAVEAFANEMIEEAYTKKSFVYSDPNPQTGSSFTLEEIERHMPLETKLCGVLPEISSVRSPRGTLMWQRYAHMRKIRHFVIHPKLPDRVQHSPEADVLWKMLAEAEFRDFAVDARELMMHYAGNGSHPARWLFKCPF
jgi:hypothetical protein